MESFSELIKARRSMRKFTEEELTQEQVVTLMKAALINGLYPYIPVFILDYALDLTWRHIRIVLLFIECFKLHSIETT